LEVRGHLPGRRFDVRALNRAPVASGAGPGGPPPNPPLLRTGRAAPPPPARRARRGAPPAARPPRRGGAPLPRGAGVPHTPAAPAAERHVVRRAGLVPGGPCFRADRALLRATRTSL